MKFKLRAWMIYLIGMPIIFGLGSLMEDTNFAFSLFVEYAEYGGILLIVYYIGRKILVKSKT